MLSSNKRRILAITLALLACLMPLSSASQPILAEEEDASDSATEAPESTKAREVVEIEYTDALDREITLKTPERVAILVGSFADVWSLAGGIDQIVAVADETANQFGLDLAEDVINTGTSKKPNVELILASKPDLVIAGATTASNVELLPVFEAANIPVVYFEVNTFEEYLPMLEVCTTLTGRPDLYIKHGLDVLEEIEAVRADAKDQEAEDILYLRASPGKVTVKNSSGSILGEMLQDLGTKNIADQDDSLLENLSLERILEADPDKIFIVLQGHDTAKIEDYLKESILDTPVWQNLTAVKDGEVYFMDQRLYNYKPNALWGEAYRGLFDILYGD